jgi:hypothetical protein
MVQYNKIQFGPAEVKARLGSGQIQFQPIQTTMNTGKFSIHPTIRLDPGPAEFWLAKGQLLDKARLTPEISQGTLEYAIPVLAGVAQADGQFSVFLEGGKIPLEDVKKSQIAGQIQIHNATLSANPLIKELSSLMVKYPPNLTIASNSVVPFQVVNGRVYHRDLEIIFPDLKVKTSGSVGFDGSLALLAETPIPPKWIGSGRLSQTLAKQMLKLPIGGTLHQPRLDEAALRAASAQVARDLAGNILQQELENNLKKLFPLKK